MRSEDSAPQEGDLLLSHGVKRSGGGWEGVVPNNGSLERALFRERSLLHIHAGGVVHRQRTLVSDLVCIEGFVRAISESCVNNPF